MTQSQRAPRRRQPAPVAGFLPLGSATRALASSLQGLQGLQGASTRQHSAVTPTTTPTSSGHPPSAPSPAPRLVERTVRPPKPIAYRCLACHDTGFYHLDVPYGDPRLGQIVPCECQAEALAARRAARARSASDEVMEREVCRFEGLRRGVQP